MAVKFSADRAQFLIKQESTPGTAIALSGSDCVFDVGSVSVSPDFEFSEQNLAKVTLDPQKQYSGVQALSFRFETLLNASGTAGTAPKLGIMFEAMGLEATVVSSTSVAYNSATPNPNGSYSCALLMLPDRLTSSADKGVQWLMKGAVVKSCEITYASGQLVRMVWEIMGAYVSYTDVNKYTPGTFDSTAHHTATGLGFSIGGLSPQFRQFSFRYENEVSRIDNPGAASGAEPSGIENYVISGRRTITATYDPFELSAATASAVDLMKANTEAAFSCGTGTGAGNLMTLSGPKVQQISQSHGEREKLIAPSRSLQFNQSSGDDAVKFLFT